jgi:hypothetical protein
VSGVVHSACGHGVSGWWPTRREVAEQPSAWLYSVLIDWMWESPSELIPNNAKISEVRAILAARTDAKFPQVRQLIGECDDYIKTYAARRCLRVGSWYLISRRRPGTPQGLAWHAAIALIPYASERLIYQTEARSTSKIRSHTLDDHEFVSAALGHFLC